MAGDVTNLGLKSPKLRGPSRGIKGWCALGMISFHERRPKMHKRSFGPDLHQKYATIYGVSQQGHVGLREEHLPLEQLPTWAAPHPEA